jgi:hypothetical protein
MTVSNLRYYTCKEEGNEEENKNHQFCVTFGFQYKTILSLHQELLSLNNRHNMRYIVSFIELVFSDK